ncbi:MAG: zinc ribbon domain-containing protein [Candidatus Thermoplasmatota archaeon]|nr:zinc ribbon domain-containing protein [Candidatus Thermoplasmatota archaeon]
METEAYLLAGGMFLVIIIIFVIYIILSNRRREVEAVEIARPRRRGREIVPFNEDIEAALYKRRVLCPECDEEVNPFDQECPSCHCRLRPDEFECPNCGSLVDPRDRECPHCGEILLPEPFVCPNCLSPVEPDAVRCDNCRAKFWSPIRLDETTLKSRLKKIENASEEPKWEKSSLRRRPYR